MTTILVDFTDQTVYTDSRTTGEWDSLFIPFLKHRRVQSDMTRKKHDSRMDHVSYFGAGRVDEIEAIVNYLEDYTDTYPVITESRVLQVCYTPDFHINVWGVNGFSQRLYQHNDKKDMISIGSGSTYIRKVIHNDRWQKNNGSQPINFMRYAIKRDRYSGGAVVAYTRNGEYCVI